MDDKPSTHSWPEDDGHVWTAWMQKNASPPYKQYRMCVHPKCPVSEERLVPM